MEKFLTGISGRGRNGCVQLLQPRRIRSSRNCRISGGTCILPGGSRHLHGARVFHRRRRCAGWWICSRHWIFRNHGMRVVYLLACVHQQYGCRTLITHMRINGLKDRFIPKRMMRCGSQPVIKKIMLARENRSGERSPLPHCKILEWLHYYKIFAGFADRNFPFGIRISNRTPSP